MTRKFYITTPIYYVNARPHIGHAYTTIACDTIARRQRLLGADTFFLTGTDEHGQKIERAAQAADKTPQQYADEISAEFRNLWKRMGISNDDFIRTTEERHIKRVQELFRRIRDNGYIYKGTYTGQYCVSDELYVDGAQPGDPCPTCGRITETVHEENYFFKLSAFQDDKPLDLLVGHPRARRSEARDLRLARRVGELPHRYRLRGIARRCPGSVQEVLAGRRPHDRQGNRPLPLRVLAGIPAGGGLALAQGDCGAWLASV